MFLERLELTDFRNYESFDRAFTSNRVILLGDNAQGKTNLLEAIAVLVAASSPFTARESDLVRWGQPQAIVRSTVRKEQGQVGVDLLFRPGGRRAVKVNGLHQKRVSDLVGTVGAVVFSRDDLDLVGGPPAHRRAFLDRLLLQIQPVYHEESQRYARVLVQRNHALRAVSERSEAPSSLATWDTPLIQVGASLHRRRARAIAALAPRVAVWHQRIAGTGEELAVTYQPAVQGDEWEEALSAALEELREREIARGQTLVGPHRDDLGIMLADREAKAFCSTGQKRTIALALKLAELEMLRDETGEAPILLLDDVLAELDVTRQNRLLEAIGGHSQTFVTSTHLSDFSADWTTHAEILGVRDGRVAPLELS